MATLEKISSQESALENEINKTLSGFSAETKELKSKVLKPLSNAEMQKEIDSGELKKRIDAYITINQKPIEGITLEMDNANSMVEMTYVFSFEGVEKKLLGYFKIMGEEENNNYIQFQKPPKAKSEINNIEVYDTNKLNIEEWYKGWEIYDVNIVKIPSKGIDIRIVRNEMKEKEKAKEKIRKYELKGDFTAETFKDAELENTNIETLQYTKFGKEVVEEGDGYYRAIFMKEGEKYKEIGKVYFNKQGEVDTKNTKESQDFTLLGVPMKVAVDTDKNTFTLENIDDLKKKIKDHREVLKTYIWNAVFGDYTKYKGFNIPLGGERKQTKLLGLKLIDDIYTFKRAGEEDKEKKSINFWFTDTNELLLKDAAGKDTDAITIETKKANRKELHDITKDAQKEQLLINQASKELTTNQEKPELENAPTLLEKDYLYSSDAAKIEYHNKQGNLITSILASKTETNEWKLGELSETPKPEDLFKYLKTGMKKEFRDSIKDINIFENDMYTAFAALRTNENNKLNAPRKIVRVLDDEKNGVYKYYKVNQNKDGEAFVFEEDDELYDESKRIMDKVLKNIDIIKKIETVDMEYKDKKEKKEKAFTQFVGGSGLLPIDTKAKIAFLQEKNPLVRTFIRGKKTENIQSFPITFDIKETKITANEKEQTINNQKYKTRLEDDGKKLTLRFDDIK